MISVDVMIADYGRLPERQRRAVAEQQLIPTLEAYARVRDAIHRLAALGPVSDIIEQAGGEAARVAHLDRLLLTRIEDGALVAATLHLRAGADSAAATLGELRRLPLPLEYPLVECELLRRKQPQLVVVDPDPRQRGRHAFLECMQWREYVATPMALDGRVVGFLHGDRAPDAPPLTQLELDSLEHFAAGFVLVFERAVLRRRLRDQQREIRRVATWAEVRSSEHSNAGIDLAAGSAEANEPRESAPEILVEENGFGHLTAREVDVLKLMADGKTNSDIARTLVVSQGTVKFHVKNILRKMQAANRADATSRYLRLTFGEHAARASRAR